ncbi:hypothetical protein C8R46DRAFT_1229683 [Mycena filopes]|nr:hypothetical protein C8R46DRAFT_1229683 [Mycena filopes]
MESTYSTDALRLLRTDSDVAQHMKRGTNATTPHRLFLPEILTQIFRFYHQNCFISRMGEDQEFSTHKMWVLGVVCRQWRDVALSTRELWSTFRFICAGRVTDDIEKWLQRAENGPLSFNFCCGGDGDCATECDVLNALLSRSDQWRHADLNLPRALLPAADLVPKGFPILETLSYRDLSHSLGPLLDTFSVAPKLRDLELEDTLTRGPVALPWNQLEHYRGNIFDSQNNHAIITLIPNTADFKRSWGCDTLSRLTLPALMNLRILLLGSKQATAITNPLNRSGCAITELQVIQFRVVTDITDILKAAPALTSLSLAELEIRTTESDEKQDRLWASLTPRTQLPKLRRLQATGIKASDGLVRMVKTRVEASEQNGFGAGKPISGIKHNKLFTSPPPAASTTSRIPQIMASAYYEIYRASPLGLGLIDTLDGYIRAGILGEDHGRLILEKFGRILADALASKVKARASVKASLKIYNHCDDVWNFTLKNATFRMDDRQIVTTGRIRILACKDGDAADYNAVALSPKKASRVKRGKREEY